MNKSKELIQDMLQQASMIAAYYKALMEEGLDSKDALKIVISYQDSQIKAAIMANIERERILLLSQQDTVLKN